MIATSPIVKAAMLPVIFFLISFPRASTSLSSKPTTILPTISCSSFASILASPRRATSGSTLVYIHSPPGVVGLTSLHHHHHHHHEDHRRRRQQDDDSIPLDATPTSTISTSSSPSPPSSSSSNRKSFLQTLLKTTSVATVLASQEIRGQPAWGAPIPPTFNTAGGVGGGVGRMLGAGDIDTTNSIDGGKLEVGNTGLLESRVNENLLSPPTYGMEASDISFPS